MLYLAIFLGKLILLLTKALKIGGGSAAPGLYTLKLDPNLVTKLISQIPQNIVITGTNGKTTTARLLANFCHAQGTKIIKNSTGSNLERGIASALISKVSMFGKISNIDLGIWEADEAAFNHLIPKIKPQVIIFLNIYRDQLDRYGEVDSVLKKWKTSLKQADPNTLLVLNGDDENIASLASVFPGQVQFFGVKDIKIRGELPLSSKSSLDYEAKNIDTAKLESTSFKLVINHEQAPVVSHSKSLIINLPLPGLYHIYDFLAAFAAGFNLNITPEVMISSLKNFSPAFGRVEKISLTPPGWKARYGYIFLIKNPVGATQVFQTISQHLKSNDRVLLILNDNLADGTDVSWIWDAEFEQLTVNNAQLTIIVSGTRAYDLAVRLKYAGFDEKQLEIEPNLEKALNQAQEDLKGRLYILPTYTALLHLQKILAKKGIKEEYWKNA